MGYIGIYWDIWTDMNSIYITTIALFSWDIHENFLYPQGPAYPQDPEHQPGHDDLRHHCARLADAMASVPLQCHRRRKNITDDIPSGYVKIAIENGHL